MSTKQHAIEQIVADSKTATEAVARVREHARQLEQLHGDTRPYDLVHDLLRTSMWNRRELVDILQVVTDLLDKHS